MARGPRRRTDAGALEAELEKLKARQTELRQQLRKLRISAGGVRKLEDKLRKQLAGARWTAEQIKGVQPGWNELEFYQSVPPKQPTPRGRRPRSAQTGTSG